MLYKYIILVVHGLLGVKINLDIVLRKTFKWPF